ncbi:MAG: ABC transporter permease [Candidatus Omnitrophica bacterium]|nr:ABC transporter permease [Candidatus Omnitrophota bacterium]
MNYFLKRSGGLVVLFFGITLISFAVIHLAPGGPTDIYSQMNPKVSAEAAEKMQKLYGLDRPLLEQYGSWAKRVFFFDFGRSFRDGRPVTKKIAAAIPVTLLMSVLSLLFILAAGIPLGIYGAVHEGTRRDGVLSAVLLAGFSLPVFWAALLAMSYFGVGLRVLPVAGIHSLFFDEMTFFEKIRDVAWHLILPVSLSALAGLAGISRFMRANLIQVLKENYIRTARAKGLSERKVLYGHALPNAILPLLTLLGLSVPGLLGGSVIFESIFSIPGMGRLFFDSVFARDYPVIMGVLVLGAILTLLGNFLADWAYAACDPRIRLGEKF